METLRRVRWHHGISNDGTQTLPIVGTTVDPISGLFDLGAYANGGNLILSLLFQGGQFPVDIVSANVSWSDRILSDTLFTPGVGYLPFIDPFEPGQEVVVAIVDLTTSTFHELFRTDPVDDQYQVGPNERSFDVTALAQSLEGHDVALFF